MVDLEEMIRGLDTFAPNGVDDLLRLDTLLDGFTKFGQPDQLRVLPHMFALMERHTDADFGAPGPLVHTIETLPVSSYLTLLKESVRRQPTFLTVAMVNGIANSQPISERRPLLDLLESVVASPTVSAEVKASVTMLLRYQVKQLSSEIKSDE